MKRLNDSRPPDRQQPQRLCAAWAMAAVIAWLPATALADDEGRQAALTRLVGTGEPGELDPASRDALGSLDQQLAAAGDVASTGARGNPGGELDPIFEGADFIEIIRRDESLTIPSTGFVPQDVEPDVVFKIEFGEGQTSLGEGVMYDGFLIDDQLPGPTLVAEEGDIVRMEITNTGNIPHGVSIHAADTQTSKYVGELEPGETKSVTFRANMPGVYMYHCAPGGHAIPMHTMFGQYGMIVIKPKEQQYRLEAELGHGPDVELFMLQHEVYASGTDAVEGNPQYVAFNGQLFGYLREPVTARPGDYVRVYFLNVGPNQVSTFHLVGIIWDYVYWQGHPDNWMRGGQTITSGPSDSWVIEFRVPPDEGTYLMVDHALAAASMGAIGALVADADADTPKTIEAGGPRFSPEEIEELSAHAKRTLSPFAPVLENNPTPARADRKVSYGPDVDEVIVEIKGNTFTPKVIEVEPGTKITWVNEDALTFLHGEYSGAHNAVAMEAPASFVTAMLEHAESDSVVLDAPGTYRYICAPHPYMQGKIIVREQSGS